MDLSDDDGCMEPPRVPNTLFSHLYPRQSQSCSYQALAHRIRCLVWLVLTMVSSACVELPRGPFGLVFSLRNFKNISRQVGVSLNPTYMKRILHFKNITFKSSYNWFIIDIHQQLRPLTANYLAMFKVISTTIYT